MAALYHHIKGYNMKRAKPDKKIERIFFTFTEAQEFLGVSHQTIYKLMESGLLSHKIGKNKGLP